MNDDSQPQPGFPWQTGEISLPQYLAKRERELIQQAAALRGALLPKEQELESVRVAMKALGLTPNYMEQLKPFLSQEQGALKVHPGTVTTDAPNLNLLSENLTIKEMIQRALAEHFKQGATPSELSEYMRVAYQRDVDRNSISPQLARLRDEGLVETSVYTGKWELTLKGSLAEALTDTPERVARRKRWYGKDEKD
jgi:DNA-binding transcriptional ArsR family regulator